MSKIGSELQQKLASGELGLLLGDTIASIFDGQSGARLPKFLVDIACGDGRLLESLSLAMNGQHRKASALAHHPMTLIGFDTDKGALHEASKRPIDPSPILLEGDWRNPSELIEALSSKGIVDLGDVLFLGDISVFHKSGIQTGDSDTSGPVDQGSKVPDQLAPLALWAPYLGEPGMLLHALTEEETSCSPVHYGADHSLLLRMAQAGIFFQAVAAEDLDGVESLGNGIQRMARSDYKVRIACNDDLNALVELETLCWPSGQRATAAEISERISQYPEGQLVLESEGAVAAVIYSQRVITEEINGVQSTNAHRLHDPNGEIAHVLSLNVLPKFQNRSFGDHLLEFMLQYCAAIDGVHTVIGVTRCNDYREHAHIKLENYIHMQNDRGRLIDTVLRMHQLHGAEVVRLVPGYRPADVVNDGNGVLARYQLRGRKKRMHALHANASVDGPAVEISFAELEDAISSAIAASLKKDGIDSVALDQPLFELGLDSAGLMDLKERIGNMFGVSLGPTFLFEHNTCGKIASYLRQQIKHRPAGNVSDRPVNKLDNLEKNGPAENDSALASSPKMPARKGSEKDVAIVGISCRLPGGIQDADMLWQLLEQGTFAVSELPAERWTWPGYIHPDSEHQGIKFGGFLADVMRFDAGFFRISPKEAELMDPQQRMLLELSWECLENAGYAKRALIGSRTGVFVGASGSDYQLRLTERHAEIDAHFGLGTSMAVLANRISYFYDWNGPSVQVDTACSSSLVAVHDAVKALRNGECTQALVAGINIMCHPATTIAYYKAGMLSREGKCRTFDKKANGYVRGEGAVVLLLKPLDKAIEDRDHVYAVIKGSAVNHGGQAAGLTVPNPTQQSELLNQAYADADVDPGTVGYVEAHGTGTPLGDPIELQGLSKTFRRHSSSRDATLQYYCGLGSIKTNIGHLEAAAGIAGLLKASLCLKHGKLPATLHFSELNSHISLDESPFYVVERPRLWQPAPGQPLRRAGVSSFGSGGTNAHVVLEEFETPEWCLANQSLHDNSAACLFLLSAKDLDRLRDRVEDLLSHVGNQSLTDADLPRLAYTLQIGRDPMECRLAVEADRIDDLIRKLEAFQDGRENLAGVHYRQSRLGTASQKADEDSPGNSRASALQSTPAFHELLQSWLDGQEVNWESLWLEGRPCRIPLPGYRFAGKTYWLGSAKRATSPINDAIVASEKTISLAPVAERSISIEAMPKKITLRPLTEAIDSLAKQIQDGATTQSASQTKIQLKTAMPNDVHQDSRSKPETANKSAKLEHLRQQLATSLAEALYLDVADISPDEQFSDMGLDSISGVEWVRAINRQYDLSIPATMVYAYPNIRALSAYVSELLGDSMGVEGDEPSRQVVDGGNAPINNPASVISTSDIRIVLTGYLAAALYMEPDEIHPDEQFTDMGLDSISGVEWVRAINRHYGVAIPATMVYAYPNIGAFSDYLANQLGNVQPAPIALNHGPRDGKPNVTKQDVPVSGLERKPLTDPASEKTVPAEPFPHAAPVQKPKANSTVLAAGAEQLDNKNAVAIVGMSGRYPGAKNLEQYWTNLRAGKDAVVEIPPERWDIAKYYDPRPFQKGKVNSKWLGYLEDIDYFDASFFGIPPAEAELMDPQHRIFLQEAYQAIEDAGYGGLISENLRCGVFLGISNNEYAHILRSSHLTFADRIGNSQAIAAARLSYFLNLQGPALSIDTACSSSLVATHLAYRALVTKEVDMAVAGGVSLYLTPELYINLSANGLLSADGKCKPFDNGADGIVPGEGVGALVLKRLEDAEADGDFIHGVIIASGINQDGRTNGITAPSMIRQAQLIQEVYRQYRINPASISYVEAHGTGTKLGDPVELEALATAFKAGARGADRCAIGSVKSNIGHTSAAAGLAGIHKVLLSMKHKELPPSLHFNTHNEHFDFERSPLAVNSTLATWKSATGPRRAAVSSFGLSGTNAHLVIEEYLPQQRQNTIQKTGDAPALFVLSARSKEQLKSYAGVMRDYIERHIDLMPAEVAYTLQVSRRVMEWRLAFVASSRAELLDNLAAFGRGEPKPGLFIGKAGDSDTHLSMFGNDDETRTLLRGWMASGKLDKLAKLWVEGLEVDWRALHAGVKPPRVSLPGYPFAKERYWVPVDSAAGNEAPVPVIASNEQETQPAPVMGASVAASSMPRMEPKNEVALSKPDASELVQKTQEWLATAALRLLKSVQNEIEPETELSEYGFDSIGFTQFCNRINGAFQLSLTPTVFFEFPTLHQLAVYLVGSHGDSMASALGAAIPAKTGAQPALLKEVAAAPVIPDEPAPSFRSGSGSASMPVAVVGMSGCFPMAEDLEAFWQNLREGKDCISEVPPERWDWRAIYGDATKEPNKTKVKWAGFIEGVDEFDPLFFGIAPREAGLMDPQQRLLMTHAWKAIEDAGYSGQSLAGSNTAIFVGTGGSGYGRSGATNADVEGSTTLGRIMSLGPSRLSYFLDLHGPSEPVETACSSALVAIHKGLMVLADGSCDMVIAGGVNTLLTSEPFISLSKAGMLSEDGRCKTFSRDANGYARGEGVGMLVLKRLSDAERDGDHIYGVIRGSAENHGGRAQSLTAPNPKAQADLLKAAYARAGVDPSSVTYIEAHGTGTPLGDPIEVNALKSVFAEGSHDNPSRVSGYCGIGSVKTNIGHLELAAGAAGVIKVLLQMQHKTLVKSLHSEVINPYIELKDSPFYIVQEAREWAALKDEQGRELPRRAGVSSFGFGGVNAHVVIEEYVARPGSRTATPVTPENPALIVLSAKNEQRLQERVQQLLQALQKQMFVDADLANIAYTLQVGREAMEERVAMIVGSLQELQDKLARFAAGEQGIKDLYRGQAKRNKDILGFAADEDMAHAIADAIKAWVAKGKYGKLLDLWVKGTAFDWSRLYGESKPRRISLPTYPFAKERYWVPEGNGKAVGSQAAHAGGSTAVLHPLLHSNTSDLSEQRFSSTFTGEEFFLADHVVKGKKVLPGVAYLELARAALEHAAGTKAVRLKQVVWARPLTVEASPAQLHIGIYPQDNGEIAYEIYSDAEGDAIVHSQGMAIVGTAGAAVSIDLASLKARCRQTLSAQQCYARYAQKGIVYGDAFQAVETVYIGEQEVLARLRLPAQLAGTLEHYVLHPSLMDGALQACIGLLAAEGAGQEKTALPFALGELEVLGECGESMWAVVRPSASSGPADKVQKRDIVVCDEQGNVRVRLKAFSSRVMEDSAADDARAIAQAGNLVIGDSLLAPVWDGLPISAEQELPQRSDRLIIVGGTDQERDELLKRHPNARILALPPEAAMDTITGQLKNHDQIDHVLWIAPSAAEKPTLESDIIAAQHQGVLFCFRLVKSLLGLGYGAMPLGWTIVTYQTQAVHRNDRLNPAHASVHGLIGSMAKEYPNWKVRLVDLEAGYALPLPALFTLPTDPHGNALAYRGGQWYRQQLLPGRISNGDSPLYRQGGVYVVIGGAGGIGEVWSEYMIRTYQAQIVWIGRREMNDSIRAKLDRLAGLGPLPHYIQADATDYHSLQGAYKEIKQCYAQVHGLVHAAIVLLDKSLANMSEDRFAAALSSKVDVSVRMAQVFAGSALDFVMFFSSMQSFSKAAGQSNYAAGCTFKDAFAHHLRQEWPCAVKVMNWGYWGSVGIVASQTYQERMAQIGIGSIEPAEAMDALEVLLTGSMDQLAMMKAAKPLTDLGVVEEVIEIYSQDMPSTIESLKNGGRLSGTKASTVDASLVE